MSALALQLGHFLRSLLFSLIFLLLLLLLSLHPRIASVYTASLSLPLCYHDICVNVMLVCVCVW